MMRGKEMHLGLEGNTLDLEIEFQTLGRRGRSPPAFRAHRPVGILTPARDQTWDEACHIFAGYSYWTRSDFGMNPEHPPLVKLLAALPLLSLSLRVPAIEHGNFKVEAFLSGEKFLYENDADAILFRARLAAGRLTLLLSALVFVAAREMFGSIAALVALALLVFDPNLLAHGALVTTDAGLSCFLFASVYAFYRYVKRPSLVRFLLAGMAPGCTLATKHSGVLVFPILALLALAEIMRGPRAETKTSLTPDRRDRRIQQSLQFAAALVVMALIAVCILWSFYGFRFAARTHGRPMNPRLAEYASQVTSPVEARAILTLARRHVLPDPYLYDLADVRMVANSSSSYLFGKGHPRG